MQLIEREALLIFLQTQFNNVAEGEGHCVCVCGEAGIGKTALVKAFCKQQQDDCKIYFGACDALFTPRPLAPLYDILWQVNSDLWNTSQPAEDFAGLFSRFYYEISKQKEKSIIVFEDIHWADEATLDFIKFFARRITSLRCLFILTYRDDEIHSRHPLRNVLGQLPADSFTKLQIPHLSKAAVANMSIEKGYSGEDVYSISGGNPFYVNEILASYSPGVPENIKDSILAVYDRQDEGTKHAWQICSVIPEGMEIDRFAKIKSSWDEAMDHCFAMNVIIVQNNKVVFKHELYRRTIEESLSPFKRMALNKKILEFFLESFEEKGEIERIVHYAKNANENKVVVKYAPLAAWQAVNVGAHIEASKLFLTAIEYSDGHDTDQLVELYEAYANECYLTNQVKEAIIYQGKALKIWQQKNEPEQIGNSLRFLSRLWRVDGNREEAEKYSQQAIDILQSLPSSSAKAMAFSNMAQLKLMSEEIAECIEWGNKAIEMANEIKDKDILCHALNNVGSAQWLACLPEETGKETLIKSLDIALRNKFHEHAARAYSYLVCNSMICKEYTSAHQYLQEGINYCEENGLDAANNKNLTLKARMLFETGNWEEAAAIANNLLQKQEQPGTIKIDCQVILSTIRIRKGEPDAIIDLLKVKALAFKTKEHQRIIPVITALLEYEWLTSKKIIAAEEVNFCIALVNKVDNIFLNSQFNYWLEKAGRYESSVPELYEPYQLLQTGNITMAAHFWDKTGCPFEEALALSEGTENDKKNALLLFQQLGADAVYEKIKMEMRAVGIKKIPRGLRESTKANPAQLTTRELEIIQLLQKAVQNKEIAGTLFISPKTVDHHISSILFKLDVNSRSKAVMEAVRLGILK